MKLVGITGGSGTGKSFVLRALESHGALVLNADEIYHELLRQNDALKAELEAEFLHAFCEDGEVDRMILGEIVFNNPSALHTLETITHKYIITEIEHRLMHWRASSEALAAIEAIALVESGFAQICDTIIGVTAPQERRILRIMERDGISRESAELRISCQKPDSFYEENCDYLLENTYDSSDVFYVECVKFFDEIVTTH